ncbi:hypothetical protein DPMN_121446 [Dreissena polymorpha]|uniref:Uncharacterized protein n=1 Tax=Dreissena polymorpha TaxID=45954 RepID=A0A9D4GQ40_DREPO|nr:hypothetical protein DPMN_121444 [Dreissena polymorpha]KAH3819703.1 hypothetical protein DPMN_121446 [Dreissena polymorpha]
MKLTYRDEFHSKDCSLSKAHLSVTEMQIYSVFHLVQQDAIKKTFLGWTTAGLLGSWSRN